jgi:hypothetical protein
MSDPENREPADPHRRKDGTFGAGNSANPGGRAGWQKDLRELLREDAKEARLLLRAVIAGTVAGREVRVADSVKAAEVVLKFTLPMPKQTHRVEGKNGDPLGLLSPEALVAFITGKKEGT